jgi:hypothetical protein
MCRRIACLTEWTNSQSSTRFTYDEGILTQRHGFVQHFIWKGHIGPAATDPAWRPQI